MMTEFFILGQTIPWTAT